MPKTVFFKRTITTTITTTTITTTTTTEFADLTWLLTVAELGTAVAKVSRIW